MDDLIGKAVEILLGYGLPGVVIIVLGVVVRAQRNELIGLRTAQTAAVNDLQERRLEDFRSIVATLAANTAATAAGTQATERNTLTITALKEWALENIPRRRPR